MARVRRSFLLSEFCVVVYFFGFVAIFREVSAEKSGWLCESAFHDDTPAVYFKGQEVINACVPMIEDNKVRNKKTKGNEHIRSCSLLPERQCIASRYRFLNISFHFIFFYFIYFLGFPASRFFIKYFP